MDRAFANMCLNSPRNCKILHWSFKTFTIDLMYIILVINFDVVFCPGHDNLFFMSEANQPQASDRDHSYCWIFNARLKIQRPAQNTVGSPDTYLIPAKYFEDVLNKCDAYHRIELNRMDSLSFAYNPELSGASSSWGHRRRR